MSDQAVTSNAPPPHPALFAGIVMIPGGMLWSPLIFIAPFCLAWWAIKHEKPRLLARHRAETNGESIDLGERKYRLSDCSAHEPRFYLLRFFVPQVRQLVSLQHADSGKIQQFWIITRPVGPTTVHPITT